MRTLSDSLSNNRSNTMNDFVNGIIDVAIGCVLLSFLFFLLGVL